MEFTFGGYENLLNALRAQDYSICSYQNYMTYEKAAILRHDIDQSLEKALEFAQLEKQKDVQTTYFVLLSSDFYNTASAHNTAIIHQIKDLGHDIGLHFDETKYHSSIPLHIKDEISILTDILGFPIRSVSMHRPSKKTLEANYAFSNIANSYSSTFFRDFKYISDSRRNWREPVLDIISNGMYKRLHILTHPFWYETKSTDPSQICRAFVNGANRERYLQMSKNIRDFAEFMQESDIK